MLTLEKYMEMTEEERKQVNAIDLHCASLTALAQRIHEGMVDLDGLKIRKSIQLVKAVSDDLQRILHEAEAKLMADDGVAPTQGPAKA